MLPKQPPKEEFLALVQGHKSLIHKVCNLYEENPSLRPDLYQEIVLNLWKNFEKFNGEAAFSTWMYRVAINTAISLYRKETLRSPRINYSAAFPQVADSPPAREQQLQLEQLYRALRQLPEVDRALVMMYLDDCSYKKMEEVMGIKEATLRVRMNRIKDKLRELTKEEEEVYEY
jgi:RNA polymerase sigma-70 factor, ECF subfamily